MRYVSEVIDDNIWVCDTLGEPNSLFSVEELHNNIKSSGKQVLGVFGDRVRAYKNVDSVISELNLRYKLTGGRHSIFEFYFDEELDALCMYVSRSNVDSLRHSSIDLVIPSYVDYFSPDNLQGVIVNSLTVENGVYGFGGYSFSGCLGLRYVTLPDSFESLSSSCFSYCSSLEEVYLPSRITYIPSECFLACTNLKRVCGKEGIELIDIFVDAFAGCTMLQFVQGVTEHTCMRADAFNDCLSLNKEFKDVLSRTRSY